ncbi:hypothetical protein BKA64DRAFT_150482 [Cadophora sp. MPI-SDFR-AT-0126]|nr:hypothetical protein BKA64DRAFT_150482 [Leotiomycetes sp. MPI-SDFR-AT-0126]
MPPLIPKLGNVPGLFGQYKQRKKAQQGSSLPGDLARTPVVEPIDVDLTREQRYECYRYLLSRVRGTRLQRTEQGVEQDHRQEYRLTSEQHRALEELRARGYRSGMGGAGPPWESPSYRSSRSQISPLDIAHRRDQRPDGALDGILKSTNVLPSRSGPSNGGTGNENLSTNSSRTTSPSATRSQQRESIWTGSQQSGKSANQANKRLHLTATSSQYIGENLKGQIPQELEAPASGYIPGSFSPKQVALDEAQPARYANTDTSSLKGTQQSPGVNNKTSPSDSPRVSSDYHSVPEEPSQVRPGVVADDKVHQGDEARYQAPSFVQWRPKPTRSKKRDKLSSSQAIKGRLSSIQTLTC